MMKTVKKSTSKPCNNPFLGFVAFAKSVASKVNNGLSVSCYLSPTFGYPYKHLATFHQHLATPTTLKRTLLRFLNSLTSNSKCNFLLVNKTLFTLLFKRSAQSQQATPINIWLPSSIFSYLSPTFGYPYKHLATFHQHLATFLSTFGYLSSTFDYPFKSESIAPKGKTGHPLKLLKLFKKLVINLRVIL